MAKFEALLEDSNDIFGGTPQSKFWDIIQQANKDIVQNEFDNIISKLAILEMVLNEKELESKLFDYELTSSIELEEYKKSLYIEFTKNIVSKLEG